MSEKGLAVQAAALNTKSVILTGVNSVNLDLKISPEQYKQTTAKTPQAYEVKNNILSISGFSGDIEFYGNKIVLRGKGMLNADLIKKGR